MADINGLNPNQFDISKFIQPFDYTGQRSETGDFLSKYSTAIPKIQETYARQAGIPQLQQSFLGGQQAIQGLQGSISNMPKTVSDTTRDSMVTEGQRENLVASKIAPLSQNLSNLQQQNSNLGTQLGMVQQDVATKTAQALLPFEKEFSAMQTQQAREFSGYTAENQLELDRLIANQKSGVQLTDSERTRMNQLAIAEAGYKAQLEQIKTTGEQNRLTKASKPDLATLYSSMMG